MSRWQPQNSLRTRCKLILHRDGPRDLLAVLRDILLITRLGRAEATQKLWLAHRLGRSVLLAAHRERAELYAQLFAERGLTVSLEPT